MHTPYELPLLYHTALKQLFKRTDSKLNKNLKNERK